MKKLIIVLLLISVMKLSGHAQNPYNNSEFFAAIGNGDLELTRTILVQQPDFINLKNQAGEPALVNSLRLKKYDIANLLIEKGADVNTASRNQTALHLASYNGNYELTKLLIDKGANIQAVNSRGRKPIEFAAGNKGIELLKLFLDKGEKIEPVYPDGTSLLHWAAVSEDTCMVSFLISKGLNIQAVDNDHASVMHWAGSTNDTVMISYLIKKGVSVLAEANGGYLPIQSALRTNSMISFDYFIKHGVDINKKYTRGATLLHLVAEMNNVDAIKRILSYGIDINVTDDYQSTPLSHAASNNAVIAMNYLIDHGAEINPKQCGNSQTSCNINFNSPLHASTFRSFNGTKLLVEKGANLNIRNSDGSTPLHNSIWSDSLNIVNYLLDKGADFKIANNEGKTPLHLAASLGNVDIVKALLNKGANPNAQNNNLQTPLHIAAICGYSEVANALLLTGAKPDIKDKSKKLPIDYAIYYNQLATADILKKSITARSSSKTEIIENLKEKEAIVYYLNHSGWAVKTKNHLVILDYFIQNRQPDNCSLANGWINPLELSDNNVIVLSSHTHNDHFDQAIWQWENGIKNINYVLGFTAFNAAPNRFFIEPHQSKDINGVKVTPISSTDSGEGFLIEVDGLTIYHPGDHASTSRTISENYKVEIDFLAGLNKTIDLMFLPVTGCSFPDLEAVRIGNMYAIDRLKPKSIFPMHGASSAYVEFATKIKNEIKNQDVRVAENRGDRFTYRGGK